MLAVKEAIYAKVKSDPSLQRLLRDQFWMGRPPIVYEVARGRAAVTLSGDTRVAGGRRGREQQTLTFVIESPSHDLVESVAEDLDRLFHTTEPFVWRNLPVTNGKALIRREFASDVPSLGNELYRKAVRFRVLFAPAK